MLYLREATQIRNTCIATSNGEVVKISTPSETKPFTGEVLTAGESISVFFYQMNTANSTLDKSPNLVNTIQIRVSPLDADGAYIAKFRDIVEDKSATVEYSDGRKVSVESAVITMPDGKTPIMARLRLGG